MGVEVTIGELSVRPGMTSPIGSPSNAFSDPIRIRVGSQVGWQPLE